MGMVEGRVSTYGLLQRDEAMPEACLRRMVHGVSTRDYERVVDLAAEGFGVKRSSVSRGFVKAMAEELKVLTERRFDGVRFPIVFIDGHEYAGETMIVALGVTAPGEKRILGLRQLAVAYSETSYTQALASLKTTAAWLERLNPAAAASLREGIEETLTVVKLGVPELLLRKLATTNPVESALSVAVKVTGRVKCWRDGNMRLRWCTAGLPRAEERFRRVKGYKQLPLLLAAFEELSNPKPLDERKRTA